MNTGKSGTILVIEDEEKISGIVSGYLKKEGFDTKVAGTGEEALKLLKGPFDLVILDLMLPDVSGEEICKIIRETSDAPIIMLTAKSGEDDRIKGLGLGADDYVVKPFSPRELVARVNAHLRRARRSAKKVMGFNNGLLVIDTENREVVKNGFPVSLTSTEFRILAVLADKPGKVLTRLQIINIVQGYDFEGYDRTIDAHIKNLRHKIDDDPRNPIFIKTVHGVGYKFAGVPDED